MKVLIIEDEPLIALNLKIILEQRGFEVIGHAGNFSDAHDLFCKKIPDIVLSDIKLEHNESGIEVVKKLKKIHEFKVIYLTSYGDDRMVEAAIQTEPIAYITKPFKESDLNAALKLASFGTESQNKIKENDFFYNKETKMLFFKQKPIILSKQEADLFHVCYLNKGKFTPMENIESHIWGEAQISSSTRRGLICRLKKKIGSDIFHCSQGFGCKVEGVK